FDGRRKFKGRLQGIEEQDIVLLVDNHEYLLPVELIEKAHIVPNFDN
ncbi:ribosome maturation factor RimP, partial [Gilvimarinus sp. 1_MG-2023]|nr:ribosome maturation factor RimP [Gilvimarinus sp. 1_MG-2023]